MKRFGKVKIEKGLIELNTFYLFVLLMHAASEIDKPNLDVPLT